MRPVEYSGKDALSNYDVSPSVCLSPSFQTKDLRISTESLLTLAIPEHYTVNVEPVKCPLIP